MTQLYFADDARSFPWQMKYKRNFYHQIILRGVSSCHVLMTPVEVIVSEVDYILV
jgi:hypothetical protein